MMNSLKTTINNTNVTLYDVVIIKNSGNYLIKFNNIDAFLIFDEILEYENVIVEKNNEDIISISINNLEVMNKKLSNVKCIFSFDKIYIIGYENSCNHFYV